jgi:hypothetical protein
MVAVEVEVAGVTQVVLPLMSEEPAALEVSLLSLRADRRAQVAAAVEAVVMLVQLQVRAVLLLLAGFMVVAVAVVATQMMWRVMVQMALKVR